MNPPPDQPNRTAPYIPQSPGDVEQPADPQKTVDVALSTHPESGGQVASGGHVPGYEIAGEIARGGMGAVLAARDVTLDREVAIKVLLEGTDPAQAAVRFVREAKITGKLQHPGIPPVHALGTLPNGLPFLAMKLIRGQTLADLLSQRTSPQQDLSRFIQIFEQIAQAVGFAHAQGIIHRDLKPANVMVGEFGEVQVMDWGLAKELQSAECRLQNEGKEESSNLQSAISNLQSDETQAGSILGTPAFMAPEQARGQAVDARADVFALGAIMSVILIGQPPFIGGKTLMDAIRLAASGEVSGAFQRLDASGADVDLIALTKRCLSSEVEARFQDAKMVANATAEYRNGVEARLRQADADRSAALAREAEQRKRRQVVQLAGALVAAVLTLGIVGTAVGMVRAENAKNAEAQQKQKALDAAEAEKTANNHTKQTQHILLEIFADLNLRKVKADVAPLEEVLAKRLVKAGEQLDSQEGDPLAIAELQTQLCASLSGLGYPKEALSPGVKALETRTTRLGPDHRDTLISMNNVAVCHYLDGNFAVAQPMYEAILRTRKDVLGIDDPLTLTSMSNLADCYQATAKMDLALPLYEEALQRRTATLGLDHADTLMSMNNLATGYETAGDYKRALPLFEDALKRRKALLGADHIDTLTSMGNLAWCYRLLEKLDLALPLLEETMKLMKIRLGVDHPSTLTSMSNLAQGYVAAHMFDQALPLMEETLRLSRSKLGVDHPDTLMNMSNLASFYQAVNKLDLAIPLYEETLKLQTAKLGADHPKTITAMNNLATGYEKLRKYDLAVPLYEEALKRSQASNGADHPDTLVMMTNLGLAYRATGKSDQAIPLLEQVLKAREANQGADHPHTLSSLTNLAAAYVETNQGEKAVPLFEEFLTRKRQLSKPDDPIFAGYLLQIAPLLMKVKQYAAAERYLREALAILEKLAPTAWATANTKSQLGGALLSQEKYAEAKPLLIAGYEGLCKAPQKPTQGKVTVLAALDRLIQLSEAMKMPDDVKKWQEEKASLSLP